jgi:molybdopterin converting factor small subunit
MSNSKLKIKLYGYLADDIGDVLETDHLKTLGELLSFLNETYPVLSNKRFSIAINRSLENDMQKKINCSDELALLPPFAGG